MSADNPTEEEKLWRLEGQVAALTRRKPLPKVIDQTEAAREFGVSRQTVARWISSGGMPHRKIAGRVWIDRDEVREWWQGVKVC